MTLPYTDRFSRTEPTGPGRTAPSRTHASRAEPHRANQAGPDRTGRRAALPAGPGTQHLCHAGIDRVLRRSRRHGAAGVTAVAEATFHRRFRVPNPVALSPVAGIRAVHCPASTSEIRDRTSAGPRWARTGGHTTTENSSRRSLPVIIRSSISNRSIAPCPDSRSTPPTATVRISTRLPGAWSLRTDGRCAGRPVGNRNRRSA